MPYVPEQKAASRARIVASAVALFGAQGFDHVTIDEVMANAGMTRGGFYKHFATKDELFVEAIRTGLVGELPDQWPADMTGRRSVFDGLVRSYLDQAHLERPDACPLIRFPESAALGDETLREAYTEVAKSIAGAFAQTLGVAEDDGAALATLALCVGGMVIARTVNDDEFADQLRQACITAALQTAERPTTPPT